MGRSPNWMIIIFSRASRRVALPANGPRSTATPPSSGVYALVWQVEDASRARAFFENKGVRTTHVGSVSSGFAIEPDDFLGARHEFVQVG